MANETPKGLESQEMVEAPIETTFDATMDDLSNMDNFGGDPEDLTMEEKAEYLKLKDRVWDLFVRYDRVWKGGVGNNEGNLPPLLLGPIGNSDYSSNRVEMIRVLDNGVCYGLFLDNGQPILAELQNDGHYKHKHLNREEYKKVLKDMSDALDREEKRVLAMEK